MKKLITSTLCVLFFFTIQAQNYEFGKVSDDEIKQTAHHLDPEAQAAILYKKGKVSLQYNLGWEYVYDFEARIKIYNQEGYDYATVEVPLFGLGAERNEILSHFRGFTHNEEDGKTVRERVRNSNIFDEVFNEFWNRKKITFPNVKAGSVLEFTYKITSPYIRSLPVFEFQEQIPVDFAEYTLELPEYLGYKTFSNGFFPVKRESETINKHFTFAYEDFSQKNENRPSLSLRTEHASEIQEQTIIKYTAIDVPKLVQEEYINSYKNYASSIRNELEWMRMPGGPLETFSRTWEDIAKDVYERKRFGGELNTSKYFEKDLQVVLKDALSQTDKALAVFNYVQDRMTWNGNYNIFTNSGVKEAYREQVGNVGEINLMLTAMLRQAGLKANPVLVSTKSNGIPLFPTRTGFNYLISAVEVGNTIILLDATSKYSAPNVLPERTLNWFGRLIRDEVNIQSIELMPDTPSRRIVNMDVNLNPDGSIEGKYRLAQTDHFALRFRERHASKSETFYLDELEKRMGDMEISEYSIQNKTDVYKPVVESFSFTKEQAFDIIGGKLYISPLFFETTVNSPFIAETRVYPIDFSHPRSFNYLINISIPDGYKIESIPESVIYELPNGLGDFRFMISNTEGAIQLRVSQDIKTALVSAEFYDTLRDYFSALVAKQAEKVILSKS